MTIKKKITKKSKPVADPSVEQLLQDAVRVGAPVASIERLVSMRSSVKAAAARTAFFEALSEFQEKCPPIKKNESYMIETEQGEKKHEYASLIAVRNAIKPLLRRLRLTYSFDTQIVASPPSQTVTCRLVHVAGHFEESSVTFPVDARAVLTGMQKNAGAMMAAKRHALQNALGIVTGDEDDDGRGSPATPKALESSPIIEAKTVCLDSIFAMVDCDSISELSSTFNTAQTSIGKFKGKLSAETVSTLVARVVKVHGIQRSIINHTNDAKSRVVIPRKS